MLPDLRRPARRLPRRLVQLYAGLALYGASMALIIRSTLGNMPWDVLHQGLAGRIGWSIGAVSILVGALVLLAWIPLRQRPGLGTVSNVVVIGLAVDVTLALVPAPVPKRVPAAGVGRSELPARVKPVRTGVVEDHIEQHPKPSLVCLSDELDQVFAGAESRIDVEEVLDPVAVVGVQMPALPEDRAEPDRGDAEAAEVVQFAGHATERAALEALPTRSGPGVPAPRLSGDPRTCRGSIRAIQQRPAGFGRVAEPVDEQEVDDLVLP